MSREANQNNVYALASATGYFDSRAELNENYWPDDGIEYRSCNRCGQVEVCSRGASPRVCADCDGLELMQSRDYAELFDAV
ncbi:hypothetical protein GCM10009700_27710 [Brevibacterium sanguinis]